MTPEARADAAAALRASSVLGVFTLAMALEAGFTRAAIRHRRATGRWQHVVGRAYRDTGRAPGPAIGEPQLRGIGAGLTWPAGVVCLRTAAVLHGLPVADDGLTHVAIAAGRRRVAGLVPHQVVVPGNERERMLTFEVTSRSRTVADCLSLLPLAEAESLLVWVLTQGVVTHERLRELADSRPHRWGVRQLRRLLDRSAGGALSVAEHALHELLGTAGITGWVANAPVSVDGRIVASADVLFGAERVIVEVDGRRFHQDFEHDRARQNRLTAAGYIVLRYTWQQLVEYPERVVAEIRRTLRRSQQRS